MLTYDELKKLKYEDEPKRITENTKEYLEHLNNEFIRFAQEGYCSYPEKFVFINCQETLACPVSNNSNYYRGTIDKAVNYDMVLDFLKLHGYEYVSWGSSFRYSPRGSREKCIKLTVKLP